MYSYFSRACVCGAFTSELIGSESVRLIKDVQTLYHDPDNDAKLMSEIICKTGFPIN